MRRRIIWILCSMLGGHGMGFSFCACEGNTDYRCDSDWKYINGSHYVINVELGKGEYPDSKMNFILMPEEEHVVEIRTFAKTNRLDADDFKTPYSYHGAMLVINGIMFRIRTKAFVCVDNYEYVKKGINYFSFTYTFTDENLAELMN